MVSVRAMCFMLVWVLMLVIVFSQVGPGLFLFLFPSL